jgi:hypothetical protein
MVPQNLSLSYNTGSGTQLAWDPAVDEDFQYLKVYRGTRPDFFPDAGSFVTGTTAPGRNQDVRR